MKKILIVTTHTDIETRLDQMVKDGALPVADYSIVVEFFEATPYVPKVYPNFFTIDDLRDRAAIERAKQQCLAWGPFEQILATDEYAIYLAAELRAFLGVPGMLPAEAVKFRDKVEMKKALTGTGVRVPQLYDAASLIDAPELFPIVAKPRSFAGSKGVQILKDTSELAALRTQLAAQAQLDAGFHEFNLNDLEFEEFIPGAIYHIDGLVFDGQVVFCAASEYQGTCLEFIQGGPLGSISVSDEEEKLKWMTFTQSVVTGLQVPNGAFHLEAFLNSKGERTFLEIGIRPGGSFIVPALKRAFGIDLDVAHLQCQVRTLPTLPTVTPGQFGWLIFAKDYHTSTPAVVTHIHTPAFEQMPSLSWHELPKVGDRSTGSFSYLNNLGSFMFQALTREQICSDMGQLVATFKVESKREASAYV